MSVKSLALFISGVLIGSTAMAQTHEVKMLNRGAAGSMVYEPDYLQIATGDTVKFMPTQSGHNAATLPQMLPIGALAFKGKINQPIEQTFTVPGLYGIQCIPHLAMGMVMLIQVGEPSTAPPELPASLPKRALDRMNAALEQKARR